MRQSGLSAESVIFMTRPGFTTMYVRFSNSVPLSNSSDNSDQRPKTNVIYERLYPRRVVKTPAWPAERPVEIPANELSRVANASLRLVCYTYGTQIQGDTNYFVGVVLTPVSGRYEAVRMQHSSSR